MSPTPIPAGGPANIYGIGYQLLWSLLHTTDWTLTLKPGEDAILILEPSNGADVEWYLGKQRRVEQVKARSTQTPWGLAEVIDEVFPSLYRCVDVDTPTVYLFITEGPMGQWQNVYEFFQGLEAKPVPEADEILRVLDDSNKLTALGKPYTERSLFEHIAKKLAHKEISPTERLRLWHLLRGFKFLGGQNYALLERKIDQALINVGTPTSEVHKKRQDMIGDLLSRAWQGNGIVRSTGFFESHGLSSIRLRHWTKIQSRAKRLIDRCLSEFDYRREWDVRDVNPAASAWLEAEQSEDLISSGNEAPLVRSRDTVLFTAKSGHGKSWRLYRAAHDLIQEGEIVILFQGTGMVESDLNKVSSTFCRDIWGTSYVHSLDDLAERVRIELPDIQLPWLTILIDDVQDEDYALALLRHPWQSYGARLALGCRPSDKFKELTPQPSAVEGFTIGELARYLKIRWGPAWTTIPPDMRNVMKVPLFARLFCDLHRDDPTWRPVNEYQLMERAWNRQTARAPLAAAAIAALAARLPVEKAYPWPMARIWAAGLRDPEIATLSSGLLQPLSGGRSIEIWHDRILNWAVAEGLVSALRAGEIDIETVIERSVRWKEPEDRLRRRLSYLTMDTLWLLTTPEFALGDAVRQFLSALEKEWNERDIEDLLHTLGERITPYLLTLAATAEEEK